MPNPKIKNHVPPSSVMYVHTDDPDPAKQDMIFSAYANIEPIIRSSSRELTVREGFDRRDYEVYRPGEALPKKRCDVYQACLNAHRTVSPVRDIFTMMVDFTTEGIKFVHPNPTGQQLFDNWAKQVGLYERSRHFVDNYHVLGTAIAKRKYAKLNAKSLDNLYKGIAKAAIEEDNNLFEIPIDPPAKPTKNLIPWEYEFQYPGNVKVVGDDLARFAGQTVYALEIPSMLLPRLKNPVNELDRELVASLPDYVRRAVSEGREYIPLNKNQVSIIHNDKRDWEDWADPILLSVMDDIAIIQKMKLADLAALDGSISHIRIWRLGSLDHKIAPTRAAFEKLNDILQVVGNNQSIDIMWGPDLTFEQHTSEVYKSINKEKYEPFLSSIRAGLGIADSVGKDGGLSIRTFIQRLTAGREALTRFWNREIKIFQLAIGLRFPAELEYKHSILTDEASYNMFMLEMLDRNVIPVSVVREHMGHVPEIMNAIVKKEQRDMNSGKMPPKAGQFNNPEQQFDLLKTFVGGGGITPSEVGIELKPRKRGEKDLIDRQADTPKRTGRQFEGRPPGSKDTTTRKRKKLSAEDGSEFVDLTFWTGKAQEIISKIMSPAYLSVCGKQSLRQLTNSEAEDLEYIKFTVLCNIEPYEEISEKSIGRLLQAPLPIHEEAEGFWKTLVHTFVQRNSRTPTIDEIRQIQCYVYALYKID